MRYVIKEETTIKSYIMVEAISDSKDRNLWKEVHSLNKSCHFQPNVIDGHIDNQKSLVLVVLLSNISAELQDIHITLYYHVLLVIYCETVNNMPNYTVCCLMGQEAKSWCTTRRTLIHIMK